MLREIRQACRSLRRSPASTAAAVISLALALGTGTTVFAVVERTLLSPPPYPDPAALVVVGEVPVADPLSAPRAVPLETLERWRTRAAAAVQLEPYDPTNATWSGRDTPERVSVTASTPELLRLLGVTPRMGRLFAAGDQRVVLIADDFWRTQLQSDPNPLGKALVLGGRPHTIVGVLPPTFGFALNESSLWIPLDLRAPGVNPRVRVLGRLRPGVTPTTAALLLNDGPGLEPEMQPSVTPLHRFLSGTARATLPLVLIAALLAVALTAINLASLLMLRMIDRGREFDVRAALGATRWQIARQVLVESHLIVAIGAGAGALLTLWMTPAASAIAANQLGATFNTTASRGAIAVLLIMAAASAWACGLVPAVSAAGRRRELALGRDNARIAPRDFFTRRVIVAGELTLAFVLLASMLLVGRSLLRLTAVDAGFAADNTLSARLSLPPAPYAGAAEVRTFYRDLDRRLVARFGPAAVALIDELPLTGDRSRAIVGRAGQLTNLDAVVRVAGPRYLSVVGSTLLEGREFTPADDERGPLRVVLSRTAAQRLFPAGGAIGESITIRGLGTAAAIIGVATDVKHRALDEPDLPTIYFSGLQQPSRSTHVIVRESAGADTLQIIRDEVRQLDPGLPVYAPRHLAEIVAASPGVGERRVIATTFGAFALIAVVIAAVGLFGVVAHDVSRRRVELAVRLALGADPRHLRRRVLVQAVRLLGPGVAGGVVLTMAFLPTLRAVVYGIPLSDPLTFAGAAAILACAAMLAAAIPARRVARTDPFAALRGE